MIRAVLIFLVLGLIVVGWQDKAAMKSCLKTNSEATCFHILNR